MLSNTTLKPFINIGPGYTIKKYLNTRGWTQEELSELMGISTQQISNIIQHKVPISIESARLLSNVFNTSAEFWINLDARYQLYKKTETADEQKVKLRAEIRKFIPVSEIVKKGWFNIEKNSDTYLNLFKEIWGTETFDESIYKDINKRYYARQTKENEEYTKFYSYTWLKIARLKAQEISCSAYDEAKLITIEKNFTSYTCNEGGIAHIIEDLTSAGIKFITLSHLSKTYLDGACFYDGLNPVIVYTGRYDRVDNFWFTLAHEIAHVLLHLEEVKSQEILDNLERGPATDKIEKEADMKAEKMLRIDEIISLAEPYKNYLSKVKIKEISHTLGIEESVIVGVLQHKHIVDYRKLNGYKRKVIELLPKDRVFG